MAPDPPKPALLTEIAGMIEAFVAAANTWLIRDDRDSSIFVLGLPDDDPQNVLREELAARAESGRAEVIRLGPALAEKLEVTGNDSTVLLRLVDRANQQDAGTASADWPEVKTGLQRLALKFKVEGNRPPDPRAPDYYDWASQAEVLRAVDHAIGEGELNDGVLSRACSHEILTNGKKRREMLLNVESFMKYAVQKFELNDDDFKSLHGAILEEIHSRGR